MPSVSDFVVDRATVKIGDGPDPLEITYLPGRLDSARIDRFLDSVNNRNDVLAMSYMLAGYGDNEGIVATWNLVGPLPGEREKRDEHGEPILDGNGRPVLETYDAVATGAAVPVHPDYMKLLPAAYLAGIFMAIRDHAEGFSSAFFGRATTTSKNGSSTRS